MSSNHEATEQLANSKYFWARGNFLNYHDNQPWVKKGEGGDFCQFLETAVISATRLGMIQDKHLT
jgi:hypothetical protein